MKGIELVFKNMGWNDYVDMLFVWLIIYQFLKLIQGTRALYMFVGLMLLMVSYLMAISYDFYSLNYLLSHFFDYFFLILIILFQEQIRTALVSMGDAKLFVRLGLARTKLDDTVLAEIIEAVLILAEEKTGALIVLEREHGLGNYIETGTQFNCELHADILVALFNKGSPLHDGALIVAENKIKAAGCFLPLSHESGLSRKLGTRHRAGIGLSEVNDCIVLIVSEETGKISFAVEGEIYQIPLEINERTSARVEEIIQRQLKIFLIDKQKKILSELLAP